MDPTQRLRAFLARAKGLDDASPLREWGLREMVRSVLLIAARLGRGASWRVRFRASRGMVLAAPGVRIFYPRHLSAGRGLNLEEGCEIVALSKRGIVFGERCTVGRFASIRPTNVLLDEPGEGLSMGDHSNIGPYSYVGCSGYIEIGSNVLMGPRVNLLSENHRFDRTDVPMKEQGVKRSFIRIEDDCWIGANVTILAGVTVGAGAVIASGAVVNRDVPPFAVVAGVPAKIIRSRK